MYEIMKPTLKIKFIFHQQQNTPLRIIEIYQKNNFLSSSIYSIYLYISFVFHEIFKTIYKYSIYEPIHDEINKRFKRNKKKIISIFSPYLQHNLWTSFVVHYSLTIKTIKPIFFLFSFTNIHSFKKATKLKCSA